MSLNKLILSVVLLLTLNGPAHAQDPRCPSYQGKSPLSSVALFDGPPEQKADLAPDVSKGTGDHAYASWDVSYIFDSGRTLFLVCRFAGADNSNSVTVKVEKKVRRCIYRTYSGTRPAKLSCK